MGLVTKCLHVVFEVLAGVQGPLSKELLDHDDGGDVADWQAEEEEDEDRISWPGAHTPPQTLRRETVSQLRSHIWSLLVHVPHQQPPIKDSGGRVIQSDFREMFRPKSADCARGCPVRERTLQRKKERQKGKERKTRGHYTSPFSHTAFYNISMFM